MIWKERLVMLQKNGIVSKKKSIKIDWAIKQEKFIQSERIELVFIDTDLAINFLQNYNTKICKKAKQILKDIFKTKPSVKLTVFNHAELYRGAFLSSNVAKNLRIVEEFVKKFQIVPFSKADSIIYAQIYAELKNSGKFIRDLDEMIASIVIREGETLYTRNVKHYEKIPSLKFINWENI